MDTSRKRRRTRPSTERRADRPIPEQEVQIVYTPAKPFNRRRFLLRLATVAAVVLAVVFGMSIFFKAQDVAVAGADKYTEWEVYEASGIQKGEGLLGLNRARIVARIRAALPYVGDVRVGIKLPDTVIIEIEELEAVYAIEDTEANWWLMDATGRVVDSTDGAAAKAYARVVGVKIENAVIGQQAEAAEATIDPTAPTDPSVPTVNIPAAQLLNSTLRVLSALEANGVMSKIETVDPTDLSQLTVGWYEEEHQVRYTVDLGTAENLVYKVQYVKESIKTKQEEKNDYRSGYMDASFTVWPDQVHFSPF